MNKNILIKVDHKEFQLILEALTASAWEAFDRDPEQEKEIQNLREKIIDQDEILEMTEAVVLSKAIKFIEARIAKIKKEKIKTKQSHGGENG